jgi:hypothetical protein
VIVSDQIFEWLASLAVGGTAVGWGIVEAVRLWRELRLDRPDRDRLFGSIMALVIMAVGFAGVVKFHLR